MRSLTTAAPGEIAEEPRCLIEEWSRALAGNAAAQAQWDNRDAGNWLWEPDGLHLKRGGGEWYSLVWNRCDASVLRRIRNFAIEVTVQGSAKAAGLSFGAFRDFMVDAPSQPRRLRFEVDAGAGAWQFRVDGQLSGPVWWNSAVTCANDIVSGALAMKARQPEHVVFRDLALHPFGESCKISVIVICNRFLQRLRIALRNWCDQDAPPGAYEILVVNPGSPDGTREHLRAVARSYPDVRVCEIAAPARLATNKGALINYAVPFSRGEWIWLTDADCLFSASAIGTVLEHLKGRRDRLFYGQRRYLSDASTSELLAGRTDGLSHFEALAAATVRPPENSPWGYTQIVRRALFDRVRYTESFNHFAHCDSHFIESCKRHGCLPEQVPGLFCLHLDHPFAWYGSSEFL
jgi:hypothetical protein